MCIRTFFHGHSKARLGRVVIHDPLSEKGFFWEFLGRKRGGGRNCWREISGKEDGKILTEFRLP